MIGTLKGAYLLISSYLMNSVSLRTALRDMSEAAALKGSWQWSDILARRADGLSTKFIQRTNELGIELFDEGKFTEAAAAFRQVVLEDYTDYQGLRGLGASLDREGELEEAVYYYQSAIASEPDDPDVRVFLGSALISLGRIEEGLDSVHAAYKLGSENPETVVDVAKALAEIAPLESLTLLDEAEKLDPSISGLWIDRARAHYALGNHDKAQIDIRKALDIDPGDADANLFASWIAPDDMPELMLEHAELARDGFRRANNLEGEATALGNVAWALYLMGEHARADELNQEALQLDQGLTNVRFNIGLNRLAAGNVESAREAYRDALARTNLEDLREHGLDDVQDLLEKRPNLEGVRDILQMLQAHEAELISSLRAGT